MKMKQILINLKNNWTLSVFGTLCTLSFVLSQGVYKPERPFDPPIDVRPDQKPPWHPDVFEDSVVVRTDYGKVRGFSVPWDIWDAEWRWDW